MAGTFNFTREAIKDLILVYEQYPEIYNPNLPEYKNRNIKQDRLNKITEEFKRKYPGVTAQVIQLKLKNLRTQYFNELNKYKKSQLSGSGTDDLYKPSWWCFDLLKFLSVGNPTEKGESNLNLTESQTTEIQEHSEAESLVLFDGTVDELSQSDFTIDNQQPRPKKLRAESPKPGTSRETSTDHEIGPLSPTLLSTKSKKKYNKKKATDDLTDVLLKDATEAVKSFNTVEVDHFEAFALNLAAEMRRIKNPKAVNMLKRKFFNEVLDVLEEEQDE